MDIGKIMSDLKENHVWSDEENEAPALRPCPFCGGNAQLVISHPRYGVSGAFVQCRRCHMHGPNASIYATILTPGKLSTPLLPESLERGITAAVDTWNSRAVDDTHLGNMMIEGATA